MRMLQSIFELCVAIYLIVELAIPMIMNKPIFGYTRGMFSDVAPKKDDEEAPPKNKRPY